MRRGITTTEELERRLAVVVARTKAGWSVSLIAVELGCTVRTVERWRARARQEGLL